MKVLKEYKEPTTIIITGDWVIDVEQIIKYTDDECVIDVRKFNGEVESVTAFGGLSILTEDEFYEFIESNHYKMHCDSEFNKIEDMYIVIKDFVGKIGVTVEIRGGGEIDNWNVDEYLTYQFDDADMYLEILGDYEFESVPIDEAIKFIESDKGSKVTDILSDETKEQLFGEIDNEGFGYWIQHYGYKGDEDKELKELCSKARISLNKVQERLKFLGVEI